MLLLQLCIGNGPSFILGVPKGTTSWAPNREAVDHKSLLNQVSLDYLEKGE